MDTNQKENDFIIQNGKLSPAALKRKTELENNPASRTDHMAYLPDMEQISSDIRDKVLAAMNAYEPDKYTARDVLAALSHDRCSIEDFKALLSPAAEPFLEKMAQRAERETRNHFGNSTYIFTPLYIANYCENYCVYCGFNCYNNIRRKKLTFEEIEHEMQVIAKTGMEEILILTGESRAYSDVKYIGEAVKIARKYFRNIGIDRKQLSMEEIEHEMKVIADSGIEEILMLTGESKSKSSITYIGDACRLAKKYFRNVGLEIYPCNTKDYAYLHECGADYVTVFQETYNADKYETLHLMGHKRVFPYRFEAQERALMGGMRGVGFSALLGLSDFRKDALATALHVYYLQRKYPHAEMSLSCPRLRPIINNEKINPLDVHEKQLCQVLCAYRIFLPYAGITVSSRESASFRNGIIKIACTKVSAGVSTGIGDHEAKYEGSEEKDCGDEQFEIADTRSLKQMYDDIKQQGLWPVLNDYLYV